MEKVLIFLKNFSPVDRRVALAILPEKNSRLQVGDPFILSAFILAALGRLAGVLPLVPSWARGGWLMTALVKLHQPTLPGLHALQKTNWRDKVLSK